LCCRAGLLDPCDRLDLAGLGGLLESHVVARVLVGVCLCEIRDRMVERARSTQIRGERYSVAGAGMRAGKGPGAEVGVTLGGT